MGVIKEIDELNIQKKGFIIAVPLLACFFFMAIVYFSPDFYFKFGLNVTFVFALGIAFIYYLTFIFYDYILTRLEIMIRKNQPYPRILDLVKNENFHIRIFLVSLMSIYTAYSFTEQQHGGFRKYLANLIIWVFVYLLALTIGVFTSYFIDKAIKKRQAKKEKRI